MSQRSSRKSTASSSANVSSPQVSTSGYFDQGASPLSPTRLTRLQEKYELQNLNDRLAAYIDRVRYLETENSKLAVQVQTSQECVTREVSNIKSVYERELSDARKFVDDISREKARLQIENDKWKNELSEVSAKLQKKEKECTSDRKKLSDAESQCHDLQGRLNQLLLEKKRLQESLAEALADRDKLFKQLEAANSKLEEEAIYRVDLLNKIQSVKEELTFKESIHEQELSESRILKQTEVSDVDLSLKYNYEQKLADTLREIREQYESQMKYSRDEIETLYETKLADLQNLCDQYSSAASKARNDLKNSKSQIDVLTSKKNELEVTNDSLKNRIKDLEGLLEQEREWHQLAVQAKDEEIKNLREDVERQLQEYHDLLGIKVALDMEIAAYRKLLEVEESRLNITPARIGVEVRSATPRRTPLRAKRKRTMQKDESSLDFYSVASSKSDIEISEHDPEGKYIKLHNKGNTDIPLGRWQVILKAGEQETIFKFHRTMIIKADAHVTIWSSDSGITHNPPSDVVMKGQKWLVATSMTTTLLNNNGDEMASRETSKRIHRASEQDTFEVSQLNEELYNGSDAANVRDRCSIM